MPTKFKLLMCGTSPVAIAGSSTHGRMYTENSLALFSNNPCFSGIGECAGAGTIGRSLRNMNHRLRNWTSPGSIGKKARVSHSASGFGSKFSSSIHLDTPKVPEGGRKRQTSHHIRNSHGLKRNTDGCWPRNPYRSSNWRNQTSSSPPDFFSIGKILRRSQVAGPATSACNRFTSSPPGKSTDI